MRLYIVRMLTRLSQLLYVMRLVCLLMRNTCGVSCSVGDREGKEERGIGGGESMERENGAFKATTTPCLVL